MTCGAATAANFKTKIDAMRDRRDKTSHGQHSASVVECCTSNIMPRRTHSRPLVLFRPAIRHVSKRVVLRCNIFLQYIHLLLQLQLRVHRIRIAHVRNMSHTSPPTLLRDARINSHLSSSSSSAATATATTTSPSPSLRAVVGGGGVLAPPTPCNMVAYALAP